MMSNLNILLVRLPTLGALFVNAVWAGVGEPSGMTSSTAGSSSVYRSSGLSTLSAGGPNPTYGGHRSLVPYGTSSSNLSRYKKNESLYRPYQENIDEFRPGTATASEGLVQLSIAARSLCWKDRASKSDPMCVVNEYDRLTKKWVELGRTEKWSNLHNPDFVEKIKVTHVFEENKYLLFHIYDIDANSTHLHAHDFLGYVKTTLNKLVGAGRVTLQLRQDQNELYSMYDEQLTNRNKPAPLNTKEPYIIIWAENISTARFHTEDRISMQLSGTRIPRRNWCGLAKSNPYLMIFRAHKNDPNDFVPVYNLPVIRATSRPVWPKFSLPSSRLVDGDPYRRLKFSCRNKNDWLEHQIIGEAITTLQELNTTTQRTLPLIDPKRRRNNPMSNVEDLKSSGFLHIVEFEWWKTFPFLSYVMGGLNMNCVIAIDYTSSNKDPHDPTSRHHLSEKGSHFLNPYEHAITAVVPILEDYNRTKKFLVLGFGARLPPPAPAGASHMFYVNMNQDPTDPFNDPYYLGVDGVLEGYHSCLEHIMLSTPTHFAKVIGHVVQLARGNENGDEYFILLILTDGGIQDPDETKRIIIEGSRLPISIIIVGIGNEDFSTMDELDHDDGLLWFQGEEAERDIVQFVHFDKWFNAENNENSAKILAKKVLEEVPRQVVTYMASKKFEPKEPIYEPHDLPIDPDDLSSE